MYSRLKRATHTFLEVSAPGDYLGRAFDWFMITLILANVAAVILETVPEYGDAYGNVFATFDAISVTIFTVEYALRIWSCTASHDKAFRYPVWGRLRFARTPLAVIDLLAFLPFYLAAFLDADLRLLRLFRLFRLLKLSRYFSALAIIGNVLKDQRRPLLGALIILLTVVIFAASLMYFIEHEKQPVVFASIPHAMYWAIITLTTVGYGDVAPVTALGRLVSGLTAIMGILMLALPTGLLVIGFTDEIRKRNFVVNWKLVSSVPLFSKLDATQVADIVSLLTPLVVPPSHMVVHYGEEADSMFFVVSGRLEVEVSPSPIQLGAGDFFGEMGLIEGGHRTASVVSLTECNLLELKADDFHRLLSVHPAIREAVDQVVAARHRLGTTASTSEHA